MTGRSILVWSGMNGNRSDGVHRVEDGFLRSRGLGAALVPPLSLVCDDLGIYYDCRSESRLDRLIRDGTPPGGDARAQNLMDRIVALGLSKYNQGAPLTPMPEGRRILVVGQVEDDASIRYGADGIRTNLNLLRQCRAEHPDAVILYKPHPDVLAGLRRGAVATDDAARFADMVLGNVDTVALLDVVAQVWTITSLTGLEALLRGVSVTCLGMPFYAGWGLTDDRAPTPSWRGGSVALTALVHAALIAYPRYHDPVSGRSCPVEVAVDRLADQSIRLPGPMRHVVLRMGKFIMHRFR